MSNFQFTIPCVFFSPSLFTTSKSMLVKAIYNTDYSIINVLGMILYSLQVHTNSFVFSMISIPPSDVGRAQIKASRLWKLIHENH